MPSSLLEGLYFSLYKKLQRRDIIKAAVFMEPGKMEVHEVEKPTIQKSTDAILKIVRASVDQIYGGIVGLPIVNMVH